MGEFYEHPTTGKLHFRAPAGGGNSIYDGVATDADLRTHSDAYGRYLADKRKAADEAQLEAQQAAARAAADQAVADLKSENEQMRDQIAAIEAAKPHDPA